MDFIIWIIIGASAGFSVMCWRNTAWFSKYELNPYQVVHRKEFYRIFTHAFMHANWAHLLVNMLVLWSFGVALMSYFRLLWGNFAILHFLLLYVLSIGVSSIYTIIKHKDDSNYNAVGASGATSAVVFASLVFDPWHLIYFFGVIPVPGIVFGVLYLFYSYRMGKKGQDNIGHDAHFWGAIFGLLYPLIVKPQLISYFFNQLINIQF